jgi:hypothetical protein
MHNTQHPTHHALHTTHYTQHTTHHTLHTTPYTQHTTHHTLHTTPYTQHTTHHTPHTTHYTLHIQAVCVLSLSVWNALCTNRAGRQLHRQCMWALLHCPASWFQSTPSGRIVSRFSGDLQVSDGGGFCFCLCSCICFCFYFCMYKVCCVLCAVFRV